jgi:isopentenyl-diphosphate delta-isomerase
MDVILVDETDKPLGTMEKMEAHRKALLHRAFSVFIFNEKGDMLLQKRAAGKYHSGGLWTNACCSHPRPGTDVIEAAAQRLMEEMGFSAKLVKLFDFIYRAPYDNGLTEHEFDHVLVGTYDGDIFPNPEEVSDFCYKSLPEIRHSLQSNGAEYSEWFKIAFPRVESYMDAFVLNQ